MTREDIIRKLDSCNACVSSENRIETFPELMDSLNYVFNELQEEEKALSPEDQLAYGAEFFDKKVDFYLGLVKRFLDYFYGMKLNIIKDDNIAFSKSAGYNFETKELKVSPLAFSLREKNVTSVLEDIFHEVRRKMQMDSYHSKSLQEFFKHSPNSMILLKEYLYEQAHQEEDRKFFYENRNKMLQEVDADIYGFWAVKNMIAELSREYLDYVEANHLVIPTNTMQEIIGLQRQIKSTVAEDEKEVQAAGRLNPFIKEEALGRVPANTLLEVNGELKDRLILYDKYIKENPKLQSEYPILKLILVGDNPKSYKQTMKEKNYLLDRFTGFIEKAIPKPTPYEVRINKMYECIVKSDPMLYVEDLALMERTQELNEFLQAHPTLPEMYPKELQELAEKTDNALLKYIAKEIVL